MDITKFTGSVLRVINIEIIHSICHMHLLSFIVLYFLKVLVQSSQKTSGISEVKQNPRRR
jgi:hypothetical protein